MRDVDDFVLEREDQTLDGFAAVHELSRVIAHEEVACVEQDSLEEAHDVVNGQIGKEGGNRVGVDVGKLVEAGLLKLKYFVLSLAFIWQVYFDRGGVFSHGQRDGEYEVVHVIFELREQVACLNCAPQVDVDLVELLAGRYLVCNNAEAFLYVVSPFG